MELSDWKKIKFFKPHEFIDPDVPDSWKYMKYEAIKTLDNLRKRVDPLGWKIITHNKFGIRGCVCVKNEGHSEKSRHYYNHPDGCTATDWHFTKGDPREQAMYVLQSGFTGIGVYYDWNYGKPLNVGFHTDLRNRPQLWTRENGKYVYFLK